MTPQRLKRILSAYGAEPRRWPEAERHAALDLLTHSDEARRIVSEARAIDRLLDAIPAPEMALDPTSLAARLAERAQEPTAVRRSAPRMRWRMPFMLPNLVGLAAAALVGFYVGWSQPVTTEDPAVTNLVPYVADIGGEGNLPW